MAVHAQRQEVGPTSGVRLRAKNQSMLFMCMESVCIK